MGETQEPNEGNRKIQPDEAPTSPSGAKLENALGSLRITGPDPRTGGNSSISLERHPEHKPPSPNNN